MLILGFLTPSNSQKLTALWGFLTGYPTTLSNAHVKGHLEPTHLKCSPLFTFSTKSLGQDLLSVQHFSVTIGSRFTAAKIKLMKIHQADLFFSWSRFTFK